MVPGNSRDLFAVDFHNTTTRSALAVAAADIHSRSRGGR
jgi:hypothetical protein